MLNKHSDLTAEQEALVTARHEYKQALNPCLLVFLVRTLPVSPAFGRRPTCTLLLHPLPVFLRLFGPSILRVCRRPL
jgi:hypothetical protein